MRRRNERSDTLLDITVRHPACQRYLPEAAGNAGFSCRVAAEDNQGNPLPGKGVEDSIPVWGNHRDIEVAWKGGTDLGYGMDRPVLLRFRMKHAKLFGFEFR